MLSRQKKSSRRSRRRRAQGKATTKAPRKNRSRGRIVPGRSIPAPVTMGAGYDLLVSNSGFHVTSGISDNLTVTGRIAVADWTLDIIVGVVQTDMFNPINTSYDSYGNTLNLNPVTLFPVNSRDWSIASGYAEYRFRAAKLIFETTTATSVQASGCICYSGDGALSDAAFDTSGEVLSYPCSTAMPAWGSRILDISRYLKGDGWYYCDVNNSTGSTDADNRQAFQGVFGGSTIGSASLPDQYVFGVFYLDYVLELRGPRIAGNLVLDGKLKSHGARKLKALRREEKIKAKRFVSSIPGPLGSLPDSDRKVERKEDSDGDIEHIAYPPSSLSSVRVEQPSPLPRGPPGLASLVVASSKTTKAEKRP